MSHKPLLMLCVMAVFWLPRGQFAHAISSGEQEGQSAEEGYSDEEQIELDELSMTLQRFVREVEEYRETARKIIEKKYNDKKQSIYDRYEAQIVALEKEQRLRRIEAIAKFESFISRYPGDGRYTPDAMFRLSELYYERSYDNYFQARQIYEKAIEKWDVDSDDPEPEEPLVEYADTIEMMQRLVDVFPAYHLADGAYYLLGYCLGEMGEEDRSVKVFEALLERHAESRFAPEVWMRVGEYYFNTNDLKPALSAYKNVVGYPDSPFYDKAMYKLAWTHYRLADPEFAPAEFQKAIETFVQLLDFNEETKAAGKERGGELRRESVQYIAITYADEQWGSLKKLQNYLASIGGRSYAPEVYRALGDIYFDQTRYVDAVNAYKLVLSLDPFHVESPDIQEKVIAAFERSRDFDSATLERNKLTQTYSEGSAWYEANSDNPEALDKAAKLAKKSLYAAAIYFHKQAQSFKGADDLEKAKGAYARAAEIYGEYLSRFPHDKELYNLTYYYAECLYYSDELERAAVAYKKVRDAIGENEFFEVAAFSVVLAYQDLARKAEEAGALPLVRFLSSAERDAENPLNTREIPPLRTELITASDIYTAKFGKDEKTPKILYKAAEVYMAHDQFEEGRRRFVDLIHQYPQDEVAEYATNLVIESYLIEKNFTEVEKFSRAILGKPEFAQKTEFLAELIKFKSGAMFKLAEGLGAEEKHDEAAAMYLKMLDENPQTQFAAMALNNAAVAYEKRKRYDSASKLYERLAKEYPESPFTDNALFRVALNAERFFDFDKAVGAYKTLVNRHKESPRRADALYNLALALENLQQYKGSAREYLRYCDLFADRDDAPEVCFRAGKVYKKMDNLKKVVSTYEGFIRRYQGNKLHGDRVVDAYLQIAKAYGELNKKKKQKEYYEKTLAAFEKNKGEKSAPYGAEAKFELMEAEFEGFKKIEIKGNTKEQQKGITDKAEGLKKVEGQYKEILRFKQIYWTLASLFRIGLLYQDFADGIAAAPCPVEVKKAAKQMDATVEEVCDEYKVLLEEKAATIEDKAVMAFETTINKAREFQVVNIWTKRTLEELSKLRPKMWPVQKDGKSFVAQIAIGAPIVHDAEDLPLPPPLSTPEEPAVETPVEGTPEGAAPEGAEAASAAEAPAAQGTPASPEAQASPEQGGDATTEAGTPSGAPATPPPPPPPPGGTP
ncbi:MAG: tetratricopeptide repeat protein [Myxococcota bacterium]|nr:tetratricopeptide repeat protein [Myxococcota bacterium]